METIINLNWEDFKQKSIDLNLPIKGRSDEDKREGFIFIGDITYRCFLRGDVQSEIEEFDLYLNNDIKPKVSTDVKLDPDGNQKITVQPRIGSSKTIITHNFADPCTWWQESIEVSGEILTPKVADNYDTYTCENVNIIDCEHGRITFDSGIDPKYKIKVEVNDNTVESGFIFNYELGEITFDPPLTVSDTVKLSYYYATDATFTIAAIPGKKLKIENVETQFSENVKISDSVEFHFEEWGYNPYDLPNKIMYKTTIYKNIKNFMDESNNGFYKFMPAMDNLTQGVHVFIWNYPASRQIIYSQGAEVRLKMKSVEDGSFSKKITGKSGEDIEIATVAFYSISEDE